MKKTEVVDFLTKEGTQVRVNGQHSVCTATIGEKTIRYQRIDHDTLVVRRQDQDKKINHIPYLAYMRQDQHQPTFIFLQRKNIYPNDKRWGYLKPIDASSQKIAKYKAK